MRYLRISIISVIILIIVLLPLCCSAQSILVIEEYKVAKARENDPDSNDIELFYNKLDRQILEKRKKWRKRGSAETFNPKYHRFNVGEDLFITFDNNTYYFQFIEFTEIDYKSKIKKYRLWKNYSLLYEFDAFGYVTDSFIKKFFVWKGKWVLEHWDNVVINGTDINTLNGYSKTFGVSVLRGRLFYFFEKDGKVKISYDNLEYSYTYDAVVRYKCCGNAALNIGSFDYLKTFWAIKDGY